MEQKTNIIYFGDNNKFPNGLAVIENFYDEQELESIWKELKLLTTTNQLKPPHKTGTGRDWKGKPRKVNVGLFLDEHYGEQRICSDILRLNRKIFNFPTKEFTDNSVYFRNIVACNRDSTLITYYENGGYYKPHCDESVYTVLSYFYKEPKQFSGGNLVLKDFDIEIEIKNNMVIYMPSCFLHEVTEVIMENNNVPCSGRYCMSQFLTVDFVGKEL